MARFPLVLGAVVSSYHPDRQSPLFGIFPLLSFLSSDRTLAFHIGPNEAWFQSAREYRLLTNEALRTLRSEFSKEELADRLLRAVPAFCGRKMLASDSPHSWMEGRHPREPWVWYFQDVFRVLAGQTQRKQRGRKRKFNPQADAEFAKAWTRANACGVSFKEFCRARQLTRIEGERALARARKRKRTKAN